MVPGIDVSHYNGVIDWSKVAESGVKFAYIKCTDGPTWEDPKWGDNSVRARAEGLKIGSYHFLRPGVTADQLSKFVAKLSGLVPGEQPDDLPPCLDVELPGSLPVLECAQRIVDELKRVPVIYTDWVTAVASPLSPLIRREAAYPLWLAAYGDPGNTDGLEPEIPAPWHVWTFWQHTDKGTVPGIEGNVDLDWFNGDQAEFDRFLEESKALPT